jgi:hypothetical protein
LQWACQAWGEASDSHDWVAGTAETAENQPFARMMKNERIRPIQIANNQQRNSARGRIKLIENEPR